MEECLSKILCENIIFSYLCVPNKHRSYYLISFKIELVFDNNNLNCWAQESSPCKQWRRKAIWGPGQVNFIEALSRKQSMHDNEYWHCGESCFSTIRLQVVTTKRTSKSWDGIVIASVTTIELLYWFILTSNYSLVQNMEHPPLKKHTAKLIQPEHWGNICWIMVRGL